MDSNLKSGREPLHQTHNTIRSFNHIFDTMVSVRPNPTNQLAQVSKEKELQQERGNSASQSIVDNAK